MDGHEGWGRLAEVARPVDATTAQLLRRRQLPVLVQRLLLPLLWTALYGTAIGGALAGEYDPCSFVAPCVPEPLFALQAGLLFGVALLVWWVPTVGLPAAVLVGVTELLALLASPETASYTALVAGAFLVAVAGTVLRARARRVPLPPAPPSGPLPSTGRERLVSRGWGAVEVLALALVVAAVALTTVYGVLTARAADREARAQAATVRVVAVDDEDWVLTVELPDGDRADVGVLDVEPYAVEDRLPASVLPADGPDGEPWVSLRAEPVEEDGWLLLAGSAAVLGLGLGWHRWASARARARLLRDGGPLWVTVATPDDDGAHVDLRALRLRARFARTTAVDDVLAEVGLLRQRSVPSDGAEHDGADDDGAHDEDYPPELRGVEPGSPAFDDALARLAEREEAEEREMVADIAQMQAAFALAWREARLPDDWDDDEDETGSSDDAWLAARLPAPAQPGHGERVLLVGDPRAGGHVLVVDHDTLVAPFTPLEPAVPQLTRLPEWWRANRRRWSALEAARPPVEPAAGGRDRDSRGLDEDGLDVTGLPGVPAGRLPVTSATADEVHLRPSPWRRAGFAVLLLVPVAFWLVWTEPPAWWVAAWTLLGLGGTLAWGLSTAVSGVRLGPDGVHVRGGFMVDVHAWSGVVGARVVDDEVVLAFGLDPDGDVVAAGGRPAGGRLRGGARDDGRVAEVAAQAEQWRRAGPGPEGDDLAERPMWPEPQRRHPDPVVATAVVLYALAAAAVVVWPYVV